MALPGLAPAENYLHSDALLAAARAAGADAVHPGYGFLAENAAFARAVAAAGMTFVGPAPRHLEQMGDKLKAREAMAGLGFPVHSGSGALTSAEEALAFGREAGYPLMLKPAGGGGGIGMQIVRGADAMETAFAQATALSERAFGASALYCERYLEAPRHIEFQLLGDAHGTVRHAFERDCSVQRRHQKVLEEAPAPALPRNLLTATAEQGVTALTALGYQSLGTIETLYADGAFSFLEMNTRLQVEHGVTELVTGLDLVAEQLRLAAGERVCAVPQLAGFAVEARIYAEHPETGAPSTGRLMRFRPPELYGVRVETGYAEGQLVTPYYDPLLAKLLAHGHTREQAIGRLAVAAKAFAIDGVLTNVPTIRRVLADETFIAGGVTTNYLGP